jgi:hypothetical protein
VDTHRDPCDITDEALRQVLVFAQKFVRWKVGRGIVALMQKRRDAYLADRLRQSPIDDSQAVIGFKRAFY